MVKNNHRKEMSTVSELSYDTWNYFVFENVATREDFLLTLQIAFNSIGFGTSGKADNLKWS